MTTRSKQGNGDVGRISATEAIAEQSGNLLMIVQSIESTNEELMYTIRKRNQMIRKVLQILIEETKKRQMSQKHYWKKTAQQ